MLGTSTASSLSQTNLLLKQKQRLQQGRTSSNITIGTAPQLTLQKEHSIKFPSSSVPDPKSPALPDLQGTVKPIGGEDPRSTPKALKISGSLTEKEMPRPPNYASWGKPISNTNDVKVSRVNWMAILKDIKEANGKVDTTRKEHDKLKRDNRKLTKDNDDLVGANAELAGANAELTKTVAELEDYKQKYEDLKSKKRGKGKKGQTSRAAEQKDDVKQAIKVFVKDVLFRTVKFAQLGDQLTNATKLVWDGIKDNLQLESGPSALKVDGFCDIYESCVLAELSSRRQYAQSRCRDPATGKKFA